MVRGEILAGAGQWISIELLVDTAADRSLLSFNVLGSLNLEESVDSGRMYGVGGNVDTVNVSTQLRLTRDDGQRVLFRGEYAACLNRDALDMSVLGRDILDLFAIIVDRPKQIVALLRDQHSYRIMND